MFKSLGRSPIGKEGCVSPQVSREILLPELPVGAQGIVVDVAEGGHQARCMELGLIPGARVVVLQDGGEALFLAINNGRMALSKECLWLVSVLPEPARVS